MSRTAALLFVCLLGSPAAADVVHLRNGRAMEGEVVAETAREVRLKIRGGELAFPLHMVAKVERCARPQEEYAQRYAELDKADPEAIEALSLWASSRGLTKEAQSLHEQALGVRLDSLVAKARKRDSARSWLAVFEWGLRNAIGEESLRWLLQQALACESGTERMQRAQASLSEELAKRQRREAERAPAGPRHYPKYEEDPDHVANIRRDRQALRQQIPPSGRVSVSTR